DFQLTGKNIFRDRQNYGYVKGIGIKTRKIILHPVKIENFQVKKAPPHEAELLFERMTILSLEFDTQIRQENKSLIVELNK
ncbi:MAG: hypothetical protein ACK4NX_02290, partial [Candidatus Paceibacteria bacterium]